MPIVKYDSRAGRLFRVDRKQVNGGWESNTVEITPSFQAIFDLENIEVGWLSFPTDGAPDIDVVKFGQPIPPKPSPKHRSGYRLHLFLGKGCGGDLREMAANAQAAIKGMDALHDQYLAEAKSHPGQLPVVRLKDTLPIASSGKGPDGRPVSSTNYQPVWEIAGWVDRPAGLTEDAIKAALQPVGGEAGSNVVQMKAPAPASLTDDF